MHNAAFRAMDIPAFYTVFDVTDLDGAMRGVKALGIKGLSVTVPHKVAVIEHLDLIDQWARRIGAVNTIINRDGTLLGTNTDWIGATKALSEHLSLRGKKVLVIGAGGSARAIVVGLVEEDAIVHIANRTKEKAKRLGEQFGCSWSCLDLPDDIEFDILVNATSVGMGDHETTPVGEEVVRRADIVMDIVYSPLETRLLKMAKELGKVTVNGLKMLLHQAVAQFELWTGEEAPIEVMEKALKEAVEGE